MKAFPLSRVKNSGSSQQICFGGEAPSPAFLGEEAKHTNWTTPTTFDQRHEHTNNGALQDPCQEVAVEPQLGKDEAMQVDGTRPCSRGGPHNPLPSMKNSLYNIHDVY